MFEVTYLFVLALAALPLALTLLQGSGGNHIAFVHRLYRDTAYILAAILGIICLEAALGISLDNYWFEELGQSHRFWLSIEYRVGIFLVTLLLVGVFVGANLQALCRPLPVVPRSAPWIVGFAIAGLVGFFCDTALDSAHALPRRNDGWRGRPGFQQGPFLLLAGLAALRRHCRCHHHPPLPHYRALGSRRHGSSPRSDRVGASPGAGWRRSRKPERRCYHAGQLVRPGKLDTTRHDVGSASMPCIGGKPFLGPLSPGRPRALERRRRCVLR
jgi:hypothetical protein